MAQHQRFGPVYRTVFSGYTLVCVADPDLVLAVARDDQTWSTALAWLTFFEGIDPKVNEATTESPLFQEFDSHRFTRKLLQPAFSPAATASYFDAATDIFERAIEGWIAKGRVSFKSAIQSLLVEVSTRIFVGEDAAAKRFERALVDYWSGPLWLWKSKLSPMWRRSIRGHRTLCEMLQERIPAPGKGGGDDLFSRLCAKTEDSEQVSGDGLARIMIGVMSAAFATTSSGLTSMAYLLAKHPEWQERLREEAFAVARGRVSFEESKRLEVSGWAWKETMRIYPIAPYAARRALRDTQLGQWQVPAGTFVTALVAAVMQDPRLWTEPSRFDPERFSDARSEDKRHKAAFLPFGTGPHTCTGMHLANAEAKAFWHAMLTRCRFTLERDYRAHHVYLPAGIVSGDVKLRIERL
jgi:cytochrome P450